MILFFYGEDTFRLNQKLKALKEKFVSASLGDTNLIVLDGEKVTFNEIVRQILAMPFLSKKRLVIIENLLQKGKKEVQEKVIEFFKKTPETTVLVFSEEGIPDKRISLFKKLNQPGKVQEFKLLEENQLKRWIKKEVESRGGTINIEAISLLSEYVGADLWRMSNEIQKLATYSSTSVGTGNKQLTTENIKLLVAPEIKSDIFKLIDAIGNKNLKAALLELNLLTQAGQNELYILSMIVYQFRNLIVVKDLTGRSKSPLSRWDLAKRIGLHPYVAQKTLYQLKNFSLDDLKQIYRDLLDFDVAIKTGKIEGKVALVLIIAKFCV